MIIPEIQILVIVIILYTWKLDTQITDLNLKTWVQLSFSTYTWWEITSLNFVQILGKNLLK